MEKSALHCASTRWRGVVFLTSRCPENDANPPAEEEKRRAMWRGDEGMDATAWRRAAGRGAGSPPPAAASRLAAMRLRARARGGRGSLSVEEGEHQLFEVLVG